MKNSSGSGDVRGARLELARERVRHRVRQIRHRGLHFARDLVGRRHAAADEHEPLDTGGVRDCHASGDEAAKRVSDDGGALEADRIEERRDVRCELINRVAALRPLGLAETALIDRVDTVPRREQREESAERKPGIRPAVEEDHRVSVRVFLGGVVQPDAGREAHVLQSMLW